ncbi:helix-turn-helix transcriptional regulator [Qipengyuania soli]|uniref:Helix-turn-helix transcriptional regulator n=1 Tax=Qipengyuania soli TaxID=2782568 RepID=A0A7S8F3K9_9SPHN|nr:helix-turn-helix transcriptional regulator [Qipengyuania soli]QPC98514.1 helix-turn-helix transcriptional regulator [Qipengyuania soli]
MSRPLIPKSSLAALNDNELEILHLLANGHTAKSIAASLGRSETAINERLREARRKTGVGSSRELARLLDAQKIWDENIDLANAGTTTKSSAWPDKAGRNWSKGTALMLLLLPIAVAGALYAANQSPTGAEAAPPTEAAAPQTSPLVGSWSLDIARIPEAERPQKVTISFDVSPKQAWTTRVAIVAPDGSVMEAASTALADGVPVPISGNMGFIDTVSLRQPSPNTLVMTLGKAGKRVSTRVYTVANDGRSMTETIVWAGEGIPDLPTTYFNRVG